MIETILKEAEQAREKYGPFNSTHEIYGVLMEEVEEFWYHVKNRPEQTNKEAMIHELMQVASIAYRGIIELQKNQIKHV